MSGIFNAAIFNNAIFNVGDASVAEAVIKTGTGGIDPKKKRKTIYKPTGLVDRKSEGQRGVEQRVLETRDIHREVLDEIGPILDRTETSFKPIKEMTSKEVDREIAFLMKEKITQIEDEEMMILLMIAAND